MYHNSQKLQNIVNIHTVEENCSVLRQKQRLAAAAPSTRPAGVTEEPVAGAAGDSATDQFISGRCNKRHWARVITAGNHWMIASVGKRHKSLRPVVVATDSAGFSQTERSVSFECGEFRLSCW